MWGDLPVYVRDLLVFVRDLPHLKTLIFKGFQEMR